MAGEPQHVRTVLSKQVSAWPPGTEVVVLEPFNGGLMVEVRDTHGGTVDILVAQREALTVVD
jgi:hypothetical protein